MAKKKLSTAKMAVGGAVVAVLGYFGYKKFIAKPTVPATTAAGYQ